MAGRFRLYTDTDVDGPVVKALTFAGAWFLEGRRFPGLAWWPRSHYAVMGPGDFLAAFEELATQDDPFAYPIVHIKPKR